MCSSAVGLKTAESFQCARPLQGAPEAKIAPFLTKTGSLEPQRKMKFHRFFDFSGLNFLSVGSLTNKNSPQPTKPVPTDKNQ